MGISEAPFYNWKKKFGGMGVTELRRLHHLEEENHRLKRLGQGNAAGRHPKKVLRPMKKREAVEYMLAPNRIGVRRECRLMMQSRTVYNYHSCRDDRALTQRIWEIAEILIRYGVQRIHILLRREGWLVNHKKNHRIYCLEGLNLRSKHPRITLSPFTDGFPGMTDVTEPVFIQAFIAKASVKTLNKSVLCRLARLDKPQLHAMLISPLVKSSAGKLRSLVRYYRSRIAAKQRNAV